MRRSARRQLTSRRRLPSLASLLAAVTLAACHVDVTVPPRSAGPTGGGCFTGCSGPGSYDIPAQTFWPAPTAVAGSQTFTAITAGLHHACALTPAGTAQCWGEWDFGTTGYRLVRRPESVLGGTVFTSLSAGGEFTCGVGVDARALCWGFDRDGQLGVGAINTHATVPTPVTGGHTFVSVSAGIGFSAGAHACALDATGAAYCWGNNAFGQLGTGDTATALAPVAVTGGLTFTSLAASEGFSCGVTTTGVAYCWGMSEHGALGVDAAALGSCSGQLPGATQQPIYTAPCSRAPIRVAGNLTFTAVAVGMSHACGLANGGAAYCWGESGSENLYQPVAVGGDARFARIAAGGRSSCAPTADGEAYCWGENTRGQLGDGTTQNHGPMRVATTLRFVSISVGSDFACALTAGGAAYCWGSDEYGTLGDG